MKNTIKKENSLKEVCEKKVEIDGDIAYYSLLKICLNGREVYAVAVSFREESEEAFIGTDEEQARKFFLDLCTNSVTPCTFLDIFCDFYAKIQ